MEPQNIRTVGVIGTGVIGASWTLLFLSKGLRVIATDIAPEAESKLRRFLEDNWQSLRYANPTLQEVIPFERLSFVSNIDEHLHKLDFVQENGPEKLEYKQAVFAKLDRSTPTHAVLASSSSGLPSSRYLAKCQSLGERILVGHPFNPPHIVPLVEVVPHPATSPQTVARAIEFYRFLDHKPVLVRQETPGFIANRLQAALVHEAYSLVSRGIISSKDLDACVSDGLALRWALQGPFLTKVLGGGGGFDGFRNHLNHVGHAAQEWRADMKRHEYSSSPNANSVLIAEVDKQLAELEEEGVARLPLERDRFIVDVLRLKKDLEKSEIP